MRKCAFGVLVVTVIVGLLINGCASTTDKPTDAKSCKLDPPQQITPCTMQWDPVCGCDGITYGNACSARGAGVPVSTPGACQENGNH